LEAAQVAASIIKKNYPIMKVGGLRQRR